jgi:hypothetical protein
MNRLPRISEETRQKRFWSKVNKTSGCWLWTGPRFTNGYGVVCIGGTKRTGAHRYAWSTVHGQIPAGMVVCHVCDTRLCVRPEHLFVGTHLDNIRDMIKKGRQSWVGLAPKGTDCSLSKVTEEEVREIRELRAAGTLLKDIAPRYGITLSAVSKIARRSTWAHVE